MCLQLLHLLILAQTCMTCLCFNISTADSIFFSARIQQAVAWRTKTSALARNTEEETAGRKKEFHNSPEWKELKAFVKKDWQ